MNPYGVFCWFCDLDWEWLLSWDHTISKLESGDQLVSNGLGL